MRSDPLLLAALVESDAARPEPSGELHLPAASTSRESVRDGIRTAIELGHLKPGSRLKRGHELASAIGVSRSTVGAAVFDLVHEGLIERRATGEKIVKQPKCGPRITVRPMIHNFDGPPLEHVDILGFVAEEVTSERAWKQYLDGRCVAEIRVTVSPRWWLPPPQWSWDAPIGPQFDVERTAITILERWDSTGARWLTIEASFHKADQVCALSIRLAHGLFALELM